VPGLRITEKDRTDEGFPKVKDWPGVRLAPADAAPILAVAAE
jgi:hypothetical protein